MPARRGHKRVRKTDRKKVGGLYVKRSAEERAKNDAEFLAHLHEIRDIIRKAVRYKRKKRATR